MIKRNPVKQLTPDVARKIAAGEVIDRPCAIVRELLDNAVDSGATSINVEIENGGITQIRVSDNGCGLGIEDLKECARPHATSKISQADDLLNLSTLGFRGEALSSIAAVSRLTIASGTNKMHCSITEDHVIKPCPPIQNEVGTIVTSEGLFENFPARRLFLKRPASETMMCRETFIEKSLARPDISFRLTVDGFLRSDLPSDVSLTQRFVSALELKEDVSLFNEISAQDEEQNNWSFKLIIGEPSIFRNDRKQIFIYVNGRKVQEYSMLQAIEYGCQGFFPNGTHPVAAIFIQINPSLVDFNIHPAKKEVRFKDSSTLHHGISSAVKSFFRSYSISSPSPSAIDYSSSTLPNLEITPLKTAENNFSNKTYSSKDYSYSKISHFKTYETNQFATPKKSFDVQSLVNEALFSENIVSKESYKPLTDEQLDFDFKYIGNTLGTFILAQLGETLYFIDQHAAHERILFDKILNNGGEKQALLIPYEIETQDQDEDDFIESIKDELDKTGFTFEKQQTGKWLITNIPSRWTGTQEELMDCVLEAKKSPKDILYNIAAMTACKAAVKDGYILDAKTSEELAKSALKLSDPHCPHGRPIWTTLTKEQLFAMVRRTR